VDGNAQSGWMETLNKKTRLENNKFNNNNFKENEK
jgi:hypothetical protein